MDKANRNVPWKGKHASSFLLLSYKNKSNKNTQ